MPINPPVQANALAYKALDIVTDALIEIGALAVGDVNNLDPDEAQWGFRKLNYLLDQWAARKNFVPATTFNTYTLTPNLSPHTIGPTGTFVVPQRPVKIVRATVILNNVTPNVEVVLAIRDSQWWMEEVTIKSLPNSQPTDLFYSPDFPNGSLYFWPVPTTNYGVRLEAWTLLAQFNAITDPIGGPGASLTLPPAYRNAMMLSLAESLLSGQKRGGDVAQMVIKNAAIARMAVFGNNSKPPRMSTRDSGVPGGDDSRTQSNFNYKSRSFF